MGEAFREAFKEALDNEEEKESTSSAADTPPSLSESSSSEEVTQDPKASEVSAEPQVTPEPLEPHPRWDEGTRARFSKADREWQQWLLDREREMEGSFTRKTQDLAKKERESTPILEAIEPYRDMLFQYRVEPQVAVGRILKAQSELDNPETHLQALSRLVYSYGHSFQKLAELEARQNGYSQMDPRLQALYSEVQDLRAWRDRSQEEIQERDQANTEQEVVQRVQAWAQEKDANGKPLRPYFNHVVQPMMGLVSIIQSAPENQGKSESELLQLAYDEAVKPYQALMEEERKAAVAKSKAAKSAGASFNGTSGGVAAPEKAKSFREAFERNLEASGN